MRRTRRERAEELVTVSVSPKEAGQKNFNGCSVRKIVFDTFVQVPGKFPGDDDWLELNTDPLRDPRSPKGYKARVECPRTEDDGLQIASPRRAETAEVAVNEVRDIAALVACGGCAYACQSPARVSEMRGELAANEAVRVTSQYALDVARHEVSQAEARGLGTAALPELPSPPAS